MISLFVALFPKRSSLALSAIFFLILAVARTAPAQQAVQVTQHGEVWVLKNAWVRAEVDRRSGDLISLKYNDMEMVAGGRDHGYWEQNPSQAAKLTDGISIDPASNQGERGEVFIRGLANGHPLASTSSGSMICDLEIRYSLGRQDHGLYTWAIFSHHNGYPKTEIGESRFAIKLNGGIFDWLSVDPQKNFLVPSGADWKSGRELNMKEAREILSGPFKGRVEHKYDYSSDQFENRAFGWSSTKKHIGIFLINPSTEYLSGGPTKVELTSHLGDDGPIVLDYWRSTHYGGSRLDLADNEEWSRVVGPIYIYLNQGNTPQAIFADARQQADRQKEQWPLEWVRSSEYPLQAQRGALQGTVQVVDPGYPETHASHLRVGLIPAEEADGSWQFDAHNYQFWTEADKAGSFHLPSVRPGKYVVQAIADGVLGEFTGPSVEITAGKTLDLQQLSWTPKRYGRQLWEIGIPNRNATEFFYGNDSSHWGMYLLYSKLFPKDIEYWIGKSDYHRDWYFEQVPNLSHSTTGKPMEGGESLWKIHFSQDAEASGTAILRVALSGVGARHLFVDLNGKSIGDLAPLEYNATINRDGNQGSWSEHDLRFPASILRKGDNRLDLRVPGGGVMSGVIYDYLRLELDDKK